LAKVETYFIQTAYGLRPAKTTGFVRSIEGMKNKMRMWSPEGRMWMNDTYKRRFNDAYTLLCFRALLFFILISNFVSIFLSVGKDILIGKFWFVRLALSDLPMCMALCVGNFYCFLKNPYSLSIRIALSKNILSSSQEVSGNSEQE